MYNCLYLPNEALSKSLSPSRKKNSSQARDVAWAKLICLLNVATRPSPMVPLGGEAVYIPTVTIAVSVSKLSSSPQT